VSEAIAYAFGELKLVIEPGGATALAAILSGAFQAKAAPGCDPVRRNIGPSFSPQ